MTNNGGLVLSKKLYTAIKNNKFLAFIILGDRDIGKSTYALKAVYEAFIMLGYSVEDAWEKALSCIKFKIPDVTTYLKEGVKEYKETKKKKPALIWDDLRKYASGQEYHTNRELYKEISGLLDTIKIPINCFIGTCPGMKGVMGILQEYDCYQININYSTKGGRYRLAHGYLWRTSPMGQRTLYPKFNDSFNCWLPTVIWRRYEEERIMASEESIEAVERIAEKKKIEELETKLRKIRLQQKIKKIILESQDEQKIRETPTEDEIMKGDLDSHLSE